MVVWGKVRMRASPPGVTWPWVPREGAPELLICCPDVPRREGGRTGLKSCQQSYIKVGSDFIMVVFYSVS